MKRNSVLVVILGLAAIMMTAQQPAKVAIKENVQARLDPALPAYQPSGSVSGSIRTDGNLEDMGTLMNLWVAAFEKVQPAVRFSLDEVNSSTGKGVRALLAGVPSDVTLTGREMRASELAAFITRYGYEPSFIRVAGGSYEVHGKSPATVFFVNKANPLTKLSLDQLDAMYSKTRKRNAPEEIITWGQLGLKGEWANRPITLYGLNAAAGTWTFLRGRILLGGEYRDNIKAVKYEHEDADWNEMVNDVAQDVTGIGFSSRGYAKSNPNVKPIALAETQSGPYYKVTLESVETQKYPLSRNVYVTLNLRPGSQLDPKVREFLSFILSREGQKVVQQEGEFLPLPAEIVKEERAKLGLGSLVAQK
jgi:phosphate transport system substrate-binding protein